MVFRFLGDLAARRAPLIVVAWVIALLCAIPLAPRWTDVVQNGEFAFLPDDAPSRIAAADFRKAFPDDMLTSSLVLVVRRESGNSGLLQEDRDFISQVIVPRLHDIVGIPMPKQAAEDDAAATETTESPAAPTGRYSAIVHKIEWFEDRKLGDLLVSEDGQASLIVVSLKSEFLDQANEPFIDEVEAYIDELYHTPVDTTNRSLPAGLDIAVSGSATFGRDMMRESLQSAKATENLTIILVIVLLIVIYRAPLLALIPLITVAVSTHLTMALLAIGAKYGIVSLFNGIETYVTVLVYGAGIDYGLFLMARYREELDDGATIEEAVMKTLANIGPALCTSAGTSIFGIGMMVFAEFGKFRQAGLAITFGLSICLIASMTLTPAIIRILGLWAFWPNMPTRKSRMESNILVPQNWMTRLQKANLLQAASHRIAGLLETRPWTMWIASILLMFPFSIIGFIFVSVLSYGLLSELPAESTSVRGTAAVQKHFPAGEVGPVYVLIEADQVDFRSRSLAPEKLITELTDRLVEKGDELGLHSIRSLSSPKGQRDQRRLTMSERTGQRKLARDYYVSKVNTSVTKLDLIFKNDPFDIHSIQEFRQLRAELPNLLPDDLKGASISYVGPTPDISDLKDVTDRDQIRIDVLVLVSVYLVMMTLLRRPGICAYLIISVFYSYMATLGITHFVFWFMNPEGVTGIDWKVPLFLFTILIAVGVDYNIFLMARIDEEQKTHGRVRGIIVALDRTGSIISSCGIIMAGTFSSLMAGSLLGMDQLGLALSVGTLLDTFVVRPIMVPSFMILLVQGKLGFISRIAGYRPEQDTTVPPTSA